MAIMASSKNVPSFWYKNDIEDLDPSNIHAKKAQEKSMSELDTLVVETSLRNMFKQSYFSICTVDKCMKVLGVDKDEDIYPKLNALHCVDYAAMPRDLYLELMPMVQALLKQNRRLPEFSLNAEYSRNEEVYKPSFKSGGYRNEPVAREVSGEVIPFDRDDRFSKKAEPLRLGFVQKALKLLA